MTQSPELASFTLLHLIRCARCRAPMAPAVRAGKRLYRCIGSCRASIDAQAAETLLWDRAAARYPGRIDRALPVARRRDALLSVLREVYVRGPSYLLSLRATWVGPPGGVR
jgi:hypothetical protein